MMPWPAEHESFFRAQLSGARVCVTGGAGFIGGHLVEALARLGADIRVIDDLSGSDGRHITDVAELSRGQVRFLFASVLDDRALRDAVEGCAYVFHLGALGSVPLSVEQPERYFEVNATGTLRVLEAARLAGVRRVVYAASSSAYGESEELPKTERMAPSPLSPYAASKLAGEHVVRSWSASYGLDGVSLRYFNIFGARQSAQSSYAAVIAAFLRDAAADERPVIYGDGSQTRDFTHVENAVYANLLAATREGKLGGEVVNIGSGRRTSVLELAELIWGMAGDGEPRPRFEPARRGDVLHSLADLGRAERVIGYRPIVDLEEGLSRTIAWQRERAGV